MVKKEVKEPRHLKTTSSTSRSVVKAEHIDEVSTVPSVYTNQFRRRIVEVNLEKGRSGMTKAVWDTLGEEVGKTGTQVKDVWRKVMLPRLLKAIENGKA